VYDLPSIPISYRQPAYDLALVAILSLFVIFALLRYFRRKQFFPFFFPIQACLLTAVFVALVTTQDNYFVFCDTAQLISFTFLVFASVYIFYIFKQGFYACLGWVFGSWKEITEWQQHYKLLTGYWSISLYLTTAYCIISPTQGPVFVFIATFAIYRVMLLYQTARIFSVRGTKYFLLSLYFCAQEITPLLFFYKGVFWLRSILEESPLWQ
jgi:hypothetical protein